VGEMRCGCARHQRRRDGDLDEVASIHLPIIGP
jgi:hypothetical protein